MALSFDGAELSAGCVVHIFNRGNDHRIIFKTRADYIWFLTKANTLGLHKQFEVIAYCLMPNHFHYFIKLKTENSMSSFFQRLQLAYAKYFNRKYGRSGHVFAGPFKSVALFDYKHFAYLPRYIHMNPVKAKLVDLPDNWPFSNLVELIQMKETTYLPFYHEVYGGISEYLNYLKFDETGNPTEMNMITLE